MSSHPIRSVKILIAFFTSRGRRGKTWIHCCMYTKIFLLTVSAKYAQRGAKPRMKRYCLLHRWHWCCWDTNSVKFGYSEKTTNSNEVALFFISIKGQLFSEWNFGVFNMKLGQKSVKNLVDFLGDLKTPKFHSEINWPLVMSKKRVISSDFCSLLRISEL